MATPMKELMMKEMVAEFEASPYAFFSQFDGLTVADVSDFRRSLEKVAKRSLVIKHSLAKKVFKNRGLQTAENFLRGSVVVTFGDRDPQSISKVIVEYAKSHEKLVPAAVIFENQVYDQAFVKKLAKLPSRHELLTQLAVRIKSPITGLVLTLNQLVQGLVIALNEVRKKREAVPQTA